MPRGSKGKTSATCKTFVFNVQNQIFGIFRAPDQRLTNLNYPSMAVGVCDSAKSPPCIDCPYGQPNDTGVAVRDPSPDPLAADAERGI